MLCGFADFGLFRNGVRCNRKRGNEMNNEVKAEQITNTDRQFLLSTLIVAAMNIQYMEGKHNIENASKSIAQASRQIKRMLRAVECGHPVEYVQKQVKQKKGNENG